VNYLPTSREAIARGTFQGDMGDYPRDKMRGYS